jgi:DNA-binding PadR family transcriptional regulator
MIENALNVSKEKEAENTERTLFEKRIIRSFTDILILKHLHRSPLVSGYEILNHLRKKFDIPFSPGTIYGTIYSLERNGLIKSDGNKIGRTYTLTGKGGITLATTIKTRKQIQSLFTELILG